MARTSRAERHRRRESALALVSQGKGFSDVVTAQMSQWGAAGHLPSGTVVGRMISQLGIDSHDAQHLMVHMATSLNASLKAEESGQFAAAVGAQKMLYELLLRRKLDHEAAKAMIRWGYRQGPALIPTPYVGPSAGNRCGSSKVH